MVDEGLGPETDVALVLGRRPRGPGGVVRGGTLSVRGAGFVVIVVRLLGAVVQHEGLGFMGDGDGAGALGPRLPVHLHGHLGALQNELRRRDEDRADQRICEGGDII